jgi:superfamily II DNA helicase RecQ
VSSGREERREAAEICEKKRMYMQFQFYVVPSDNCTDILQEMNAFLRSHRILEVDRQFVGRDGQGFWHICIKYLESPSSRQGSNKPDYKFLLDEAQFSLFSKLRVRRKAIAEDLALPPYAVFTDEELSGIAQLEKVSVENLQKVKGIGAKKLEKYGELILKDCRIQPIKATLPNSSPPRSKRPIEIL